MIRSLITPQTTDLHIAIPDDYVGKKVEVLVFTYDETTRHKHVAKSKAERADSAQLTTMAMMLSEKVLQEDWANEDDAHWERFRYSGC